MKIVLLIFTAIMALSLSSGYAEMPPMSPTEHANHHVGDVQAQGVKQILGTGNGSQPTAGSVNSKENMPAMNMAAPTATSNIPITSPRIPPSAEPKVGTDITSQ
ncbi:MAG: hypothetical protein K2Q01_02360 [Rickettsiales bacterium]|nr:hypothetical protein [Rickettsiales bacterium]